MSFLTTLRAERHLAAIKASPDRTRPATQHAIAKLKRLGPGAIEPVIAALPDADPAATVALVEVLGALLTEGTFPTYIRALLKGNARITSGITWALTGARNYPAPLLLKALAIQGVPKPALLEVIFAQKARFTVRDLLTSTYGHQPAEKAVLFRIIGDIADRSSVPLLIGALAVKDTMSRVHLINLLTRFNAPEVYNALTVRLSDPDKQIRVAVLAALQRMDGPIDARSVSALLLDPEMEVQSRVVDLLILKANQPPTVQYLIDVLKEPKPSARRFAVEVLNEIGLRHLLLALKGSDWQLRGRIALALGKTGGTRLIQSALHLVQDPDESVRRAAIDILNHAKDESAVDWLMEATGDLDSWVRERAVDALAEIGSKRAVPRLLELLESQNAPSLPAVVRALGRLGDTEQVDVLMPFLSHGERDVRIEAIQALANLVDASRAAQLTTTLQLQLDSPDPTVSRIASFAIEVIESRTANGGRLAVGGDPPRSAGARVPRPLAGAAAAPRPPGARSCRCLPGRPPRACPRRRQGWTSRACRPGTCSRAVTATSSASAAAPSARCC
jgi:serine/threonine-protein kinase